MKYLSLISFMKKQLFMYLENKQYVYLNIELCTSLLKSVLIFIRFFSTTRGASFLYHLMSLAGTVPPTSHRNFRKSPASLVIFLSSFRNAKVFFLGPSASFSDTSGWISSPRSSTKLSIF